MGWTAREHTTTAQKLMRYCADWHVETMSWSGTGPAFTNTPPQALTRTARIVGLLNLHRAVQIRSAIHRYPVLVDTGVLDQVGRVRTTVFVARHLRHHFRQ